MLILARSLQLYEFLICMVLIMKPRNVIGMSKFWEKLGKPRFASAPMVDHSSLPWRLFLQKHGVQLTYSQMINSHMFLQDECYRKEMMDWLYIPTNMKSQVAPCIAQIAGDDPHKLVEVGKILQNSVTAIDLNLGCPQKIARRGNYGAFLLPQRDLVLTILSTLVNELSVPITAKIRLFPDLQDSISLVKDMQSCGISLLTVHGRTKEMNKLFTGPANWDAIQQIVHSVDMPVLSNGGIETYQNAIDCLEYTQADGIMGGEALLENPRLFSPEGDEDFRCNYLTTQLGVVEEFLTYVEKFYTYGKDEGDEKARDVAKPGRSKSNLIRGHLFKLLHRFLHAPANMHLIPLIAEGEYEQLVSIVSEIREKAERMGGDEERAIREGVMIKTTWYRRHRDEIAQRRIIPRPRETTLNLMNIRIEEKKSQEESEEQRKERQAKLKATLLAKKESKKATSYIS